MNAKTEQLKRFTLTVAKLRQTFRFSMRTATLAICAALAAGCAMKSPFVEPAHTSLAALTVGRPDVHDLISKAALPVSVQELLSATADVGEPFDGGCSGSGPHKRFIAAKAAGPTYYVAIEEGGVAHKWFINQYVVDEKDKVIETRRIEPK